MRKNRDDFLLFVLFLLVIEFYYYDYHMMNNIGTPIPDGIELSDTITLFRLISACDDDFQSMRLEKLGEKYVDPTAKFAGHQWN